MKPEDKIKKLPLSHREFRNSKRDRNDDLQQEFDDTKSAKDRLNGKKD